MTPFHETIYFIGGSLTSDNLHLLMTYWFVFELVIHVGIFEFDPKVLKYYKAILRSGKEGLIDTHYSEVVDLHKIIGSGTETWYGHF